MAFNPKNQIVYSLDGKLRTNDGYATNLDKVIQEIPNDSDAIVIWFHGGLISTKAGTDIAKRIGPYYADRYPDLKEDIKSKLPGKPYPIFFVWDSGPVNSVIDAAAAALVHNLVKIPILKLAALLGFKLENDRDLGLAAAAEQDLTLSQDEQQALYDALSSDAEFMAQVGAMTSMKASLAQGIDLPPALAKQTNEAITDFISRHQDKEADLQLSPAVTWAIVRGFASIAARVLKRILTKRDHGVLQTVIEESVRSLRVPDVWKQMKVYTEEAFEDDGVGTLFLKALAERPELKTKRILLVGHSTGAIYISNLLKSQYAEGWNFEVRFLAPAVRFDKIAADLPQYKASVFSFRSYGMTDPVEHSEYLFDIDPVSHVQIIKQLYQGSLLYMVSGALEHESEMDMSSDAYADCPLIGMQRYIIRPGILKGSEQSTIDGVRNRFDHTWVYGPTDTGAPYPCNSKSHGGFDDINKNVAEPAVWSLLMK